MDAAERHDAGARVKKVGELGCLLQWRVDVDRADDPRLVLGARGGPVATGELTWPTSSNGIEEHAAGLLEVAEGTLIEGCPPSAPPPLELVRKRIRVHSADAVPGLDKELIEHFRTWRPMPACKPSAVP